MEFKQLMGISWSNLITSILIIIAILYICIKSIKKLIKNR